MTLLNLLNMEGKGKVRTSNVLIKIALVCSLISVIICMVLLGLLIFVIASGKFRIELSWKDDMSTKGKPLHAVHLPPIEFDGESPTRGDYIGNKTLGNPFERKTDRNRVERSKRSTCNSRSNSRPRKRSNVFITEHAALHLLPLGTGHESKIAPNGMFGHWQDTLVGRARKTLKYDPALNGIKVLKAGVYFLYGQVYYHFQTSREMGHCIFYARNPVAKTDLRRDHRLTCSISAPYYDYLPTSPPGQPRHYIYKNYNSNSVFGTFYLKKGDFIWLAVQEGCTGFQVNIGIEATYFGAFKLQ